jgi:23S rRNA (adenine2503-C2)-methyltransferase
MNCAFCATGKMGFARNLEAEEIVDQVLEFARLLNATRGWTSGYSRRSNLGIIPCVTNVVFMGMGEPFLNYDEVMAAIKILNDKDGLNIGSRHIAVSTVGIPEEIEKFAKESLQVNLAISLHAPDDKLRSQIAPINKKYPLKDILQAAKHYLKKTNRKLMFEYVMMKGVNDSDRCARDLAMLLKNFPRHLIMVNLIKYNLTGQFSPSLPERVKEFKQILIDSGLQATERYHFGGDIKGACGQLAALGVADAGREL